MASTHASVPHLTRVLANLVVLSMKTRNAHWNVSGPHFHSAHAFFESLYEALEPAIDDVAERIRALGAPAPGYLPDLLAAASLKEQPSSVQSAEAFVSVLLADYEAMIASLHAEIHAGDKADDHTTTDLLSGLLAQFEKSAWMLRSHQ